MFNALSPARMSADERFAELCDLLAAGLVRLTLRQSSPLSSCTRDSCVDFSLHQSGGANAKFMAEAS